MSSQGLDQLAAIWPLLLPLALAELALVVFCLFDIFRADRRVRGGSKLLWAVIVLLIGTLGPLAYLFFGREDM
ncbi:MAG TPA: PLD nuclease N-terminal domain-containing protein [Ktedonobacterales bacterium]|nr:PLD nuclease N-terminal domain-containing protein [Ktedonobacterales bacterium]